MQDTFRNRAILLVVALVVLVVGIMFIRSDYFRRLRSHLEENGKEGVSEVVGGYLMPVIGGGCIICALVPWPAAWKEKSKPEETAAKPRVDVSKTPPPEAKA